MDFSGLSDSQAEAEKTQWGGHLRMPIEPFPYVSPPSFRPSSRPGSGLWGPIAERNRKVPWLNATGGNIRGELEDPLELPEGNQMSEGTAI